MDTLLLVHVRGVDLAFSVMEADEIVDIVAHVSQGDVDAELLQRLRELPKDQVTKGASGTQRGRSSQFELYMRSLLVRAGLQVEMGTPDLLVSNDAEEVTDLEVKRPISSNGLDPNVRKAISQISKRPNGSIVISLDHLILRGNGIIVREGAESIQDAATHLEQVTTVWLQKHRPIIMQRVSRSKASIGGLIFLAKAPVISETDRTIGFAFHLRVVGIPPPEAKAREGFGVVTEALQGVWGVPS